MPAAQPLRRSLDGLSPWDADAVRRFAIQRVNDDVIRNAHVTPRLLLICQDHVEDLDLTATEGDPIATFMALEARSDVEHRILCGSLGDGDQRLAWVFGAANDEERTWWSASRAFTRLPGGLGSAEVNWELVWGEAFERPSGFATSLSRPGPALELGPAVPVPMPAIGARIDPVPPTAVVPTDPAAATNVVFDLGYEAKLIEEPMEGVMLFLFRGRTLERWHVTGEIPCGLDDLVRAACAHGAEQPVAVVALRVDLFDYNGTIHRAVRMVSEADGLRFERVLAMLHAEGDGYRPSNVQYFGSAPQPVGTDGWIGVEPVTELDLFLLGPSE